ncbi:hypothetical protein MKX01_007159 [Papaver californicum]|nr:hypothetical protein MKX01_007159 [Papaver californicum]
MYSIISSSLYSNFLNSLPMSFHMVLVVFAGLCCGSSTTSSASTPQGNNKGFQRPAIYILGDSLVDVGNNNYIDHNTFTKNNFLPYGIDFPSGKTSTGRYSNGRTLVDIVGHRINMDAQLDNFANTRNYLISRLGDRGSNKFLAKALFIVVMGSNDFIDNYFIPFLSIPEQKMLTPEMFVDLLISRFRLQLTRLYEMGARKVAVANVGPVGCIPLERGINRILNKTEWHTTDDSCIDEMNDAAMYFNKKLKSLVMEFNSRFVASKFLYVDIYGLFTNVIGNYQSYGFENYKDSCCQTLPGPLRGLLPVQCGRKGL